MKKYLCIDLGHDTIKVAHAKIDSGKIEFLEVKFVKTPLNLFVNGQVSDFDGFRSIIAPHAKDGYSSAILIVPNEMVTKRILTLPSVPHMQLVSMVKTATKDFYQGSPDDYVFRSDIIETTVNPTTGKENNEVIATAAKVDLMKAFSNIFKEVGVKLEYIDFESNAFVKFGKMISSSKGKTTAFVDFGSSSCELIVQRKNGSIYFETIPIASAKIDILISNELGISRSDAEKLKRNYHDIAEVGEHYASVAEGFVKTVVNEILETLSRYISSSLVESGETPEAFYISGGFSNSEYLVDAINEKFDVSPTRIWNTKASYVDFPTNYKRSFPSFAAIVGLLNHIKNEKSLIKMNLLPNDILYRKERFRKKMLRISVALIFLLVMTIYAFFPYFMTQNVDEEISEYDQKITEAQNTYVLGLNAQQAADEATLATLTELVGNLDLYGYDFGELFYAMNDIVVKNDATYQHVHFDPETMHIDIAVKTVNYTQMMRDLQELTVVGDLKIEVTDFAFSPIQVEEDGTGILTYTVKISTVNEEGGG